MSLKALQNLGRSITGNAVKAVLCVRNTRQAKAENDPFTKDSQKELEKVIPNVKALNRDLMDMAKKSLEGRGGSNTYSDLKSVVKKYNYIALEVQFNPSSLRLNTSAGMQTVYGEDATDPTVQTVQKPAATEMYFELLFDDCNSQDAFMLEGNALTNASVGNAYQAIKSAAVGKFSVQKQMEGLLGMISLDTARHVVFFWGDLCFRGEVTAVSTTYTMFNKKGYPIRGKVGINIRQGDGYEGTDKNIYNYDEQYWDAAFDRIFKDKVENTYLDKLSNNLLNLKL